MKPEYTFDYARSVSNRYARGTTVMIDKHALHRFGAQVLRLALALIADTALDLPGTPDAEHAARTAIEATAASQVTTRQKRKYTKRQHTTKKAPNAGFKYKPGTHWTQTPKGKRILARNARRPRKQHKQHWTQTPDGRARMAMIASSANAKRKAAGA